MYEFLPYIASVVVPIVIVYIGHRLGASRTAAGIERDRAAALVDLYDSLRSEQDRRRTAEAELCRLEDELRRSWLREFRNDGDD